MSSSRKAEIWLNSHMSIRSIKPDDPQTWNNAVTANPDGGSILQGYQFLQQKARAGWTIRFFEVNDRAIGVMEKHVFPLGRIWYIPKGPSTTSVDDLASLLDELVPYARNHGVVSIKIEPELPHDTDMSALVSRFGLQKTTPIQYNYATVLVDLSPPLDDILMSFNQKGRHALRRAERDGVSVERVEPTDENCRIMYDLLRATGESAGFAVRPYEYYRRFYQSYGDNGGLFLAYFNDQVVAGGFAMVQGKKSMYKDGASLRDRPAYGASHLLQWHIIQWAKERGSVLHDLAGAPPVAHAHDQSHPFYAIGKFKRQFTNQITEYAGAYDVPVVGWKAKLWHAKLEKIIRKLHFITHKESWY